jgi:hypothetical protein
MQRFTIRVLVASLKFMIGSGLAFEWQFVRYRPLSLCSLTNNPDRFDRQTVRVRGELYVNPYGAILLKSMDSGLGSGDFAVVNFKNILSLLMN